jgi:hypothetical protein
LKYVGGDMFEAVPPADVILLKVNFCSFHVLISSIVSLHMLTFH